MAFGKTVTHELSPNHFHILSEPVAMLT